MRNGIAFPMQSAQKILSMLSSRFLLSALVCATAAAAVALPALPVPALAPTPPPAQMLAPTPNSSMFSCNQTTGMCFEDAAGTQPNQTACAAGCTAAPTPPPTPAPTPNSTAPTPPLVPTPAPPTPDPGTPTPPVTRAPTPALPTTAYPTPAPPTPAPPTPEGWTPSPTRAPTPQPTAAADGVRVVVATTLTGFELATFTAGPQMSYRRAIAAEAAGIAVGRVILSNICVASRRLDEQGGREFAAAAVDFDTEIFVADAGAAATMKTTVAAITPAAIQTKLVAELKAAKESGDYADLANVNINDLAATITVAEAAPTVLTPPGGGGGGSGGGSKIGAEVAVPVVLLAVGGLWFVRRRNMQEASARKSGSLTQNFLQASDQDLDSHYSAL